MHQFPLSRSRRRSALTALFSTAVLIGAALVGGSASASAAPADADAGAAASAATVRSFDAVTTAAEKDGWKHLALIGTEYMIFNDRGVFEGPRKIRDKWGFLPERFTHDVDAASVVFQGNRWKYMFVQGTERIVFTDGGIADGPQSYPAKWPFLGPELSNGLDAVTAHMSGNLWVHLATAGEWYAIFDDTGLRSGPGLIRTRYPGLPERFMGGLDDASIEVESDGSWKISFYKGDERLIFSTTGGIIELVTLSSKWPFLNAWRAAAA